MSGTTEVCLTLLVSSSIEWLDAEAHYSDDSMLMRVLLQ